MADTSSNHEIMKMLLSSPSQISPKHRRRMDLVKTHDSDHESGPNLITYLELVHGQREDFNAAQMDHNYSLPWHCRPDNSLAKPAKLLFVSKNQNDRFSDDISVDVVENPPPPRPAYDQAKSTHMMEETNRLILLLRMEPGEQDWETKIDRSDWTNSQNRLFERVARILHLERMSRLANKGSWNEPVQRRVSLDKTAKRFRVVMNYILWKPKLTQWLHNILLENLEVNYLTIYVEILQTLHRKIPQLVERVTSATTTKVNIDALNLLLKKNWDPANTLSHYKQKRLPGNPLFVIVPYGPNGGTENSPRIKRWLPYLTSLGTVIPIQTNSTNKVTIITSLEHMMASTRSKLTELKSSHPGKPIILLGIGTGSALAVQVALMEKVSAIVCLGFPVNTVEDKRGQPDDNMLNLTTPTIFVIGQHAATAYVDDVEDIREKLKVETGLVVVGSGDDQLRIPMATQKIEGITQGMLDRCIIDEISDFLGSILTTTNKVSTTVMPQTNDLKTNKFKLIERKRKISIQEDAYPPRKQFVHTIDMPNTGGIIFNSPAPKRGGGRGRGRAKYNSQLSRDVMVNSESVIEIHQQPRVEGGRGRGRRRIEPLRNEPLVLPKPSTPGMVVSRRGGITEKGVTRPSIENISVVNSSNIANTALSGETSFTILPQIRVIGNEELATLETTENFPIDQLTADTLLEMPVIIATDTQEVHQPRQTSQKVVEGTSRAVPQAQLSGTGVMKNATIYFRKRGTVYHRARLPKINVSGQKIRKPPLARGSAIDYTEN